MKEEVSDPKDFLQSISDQIYYFLVNTIDSDFVIVLHILANLILLAGIVLVFDFIVKFLVNFFFKFFFKNKEKYPVFESVYKSRITNSFVHLGTLTFATYTLSSIFYRYPKGAEFLEKITDIGAAFVIAGMLYRSLVAFRNYYAIKNDFYKVMAINAISETVKILGIFLFAIVIICLIFGINGTTLLGSLGAITAVLVLVFRDTILGFVTGIHVATSKSLKVGDWIGISKYNIEGNILDISLLTTKISNFDKTISSIPTYDLLTTEIRNYQVMKEGNLRRIKRSIIFNVKSFHFLTIDEIENLRTVNLISEYLESPITNYQTEDEISKNTKNNLNYEKLTNIGVFRKYVLNYLKNNSNINQNETLLVRQLEMTPQGFPLEIYCFANFSDSEQFEGLQSDVFDHLLVAANSFGLEVMQINKI